MRRALVVAILAVAGQLSFGSAGAEAPAQVTDPLLERGRQLYTVGCVTCHGLGGKGTDRGPTLVGVGAASADFYLTTGRMPMAAPAPQSYRKRPAYPPEDIAAIVAYVASLGDGPPIPAVAPDKGSLQRGGDYYRANCAACHAYAGSGGALQDGQNAVSLHESTATQIAEAIRIGPGSMPPYSNSTLTEDELNDVTRYVLYLQEPSQRGGAPLGNRGPIPEGFVAWFGGLGLLIAASFWVGKSR